MARSVTRRGFAARVGGAGLLLVTLAGCGRDKKTAQPVPPGSPVLARGDPLTFGTAATAETSYPTVPAVLTGGNVVNAGVSGATSAPALARLPAP